MAGHNVFHVEFGINETELSRALEERDYSKARQLLLDNSNTSYLDEGQSINYVLNIICTFMHVLFFAFLSLAHFLTTFY